MRPKNTTKETTMITAQTAEHIKNDLDSLKDMAGAGELREKTDYSPTSQIDDLVIDKESIKHKIKILERQLDAHANQRVKDPAKRRQLESRREELERKFKDVLETYRDLGVVRRDSPDWGPALKKALERHKYDHLIREWKRIGLMLEPGDPMINNMDRLRSNG